MTHVITRACCNDAACVPVCPVNCIHPTPDEPDYLTAEMLYIDPKSCIDCQACVDICPVGAIVADYDLEPEQERFQDINARWFANPAHAEYEEVQQVVAKRTWNGEHGPLKVAIVGSGPAACYAADELMSQRGLDVSVDMFERLLTPTGLVRFGVAPDHQDTKAAAEAFSRVFMRPGFRLFLDTEVGVDITHQQLAERYHAVIYGVGALGDRPLGIPGEDLPGSMSATEFVSWYNGHPEFADSDPDLSSERVVIIGNGNVALDVARVLAAGADYMSTTDIADHALEKLRDSAVREVLVIGRRGPTDAAFTSPELLGLADVPDIDIVVDPADLVLDDTTRERAGEPEWSVPLLKTELLAELGTEPERHDRRVVLRFCQSPVEILGSDRVEGIRLVRNRLVERDGRVVAEPTDEFDELSCGLVLRSIGYQGHNPAPELPFDDARGVVPNEKGRVVDPEPGLPGGRAYVTGWIKRGPSGVIGTNKWCAKETVGSLLDDYSKGQLPEPTMSADVAEIVGPRPGALDWRRLDEHERKTGRAAGRPRLKLVDRADLMAIVESAP